MIRKNLSLDDDVVAVDGFPGRGDSGRQDLNGWGALISIWKRIENPNWIVNGDARRPFRNVREAASTPKNAYPSGITAWRNARFLDEIRNGGRHMSGAVSFHP
jgi:hypothetical protein